MWDQRPSFRFEIDNFLEKESVLSSQIFVSGGCEWYLEVYPKGDRLSDGHVSLYLTVGNRKSLGTGWKRSVNYYFVVLNQSDKELFRSPIGGANNLFCAEALSWGFRKTLPLSKVHGKEFSEKDTLIIEVYIKVAEALDGEGEDESEKKESVDFNGFQAFASQVNSVRKMFAEHVVKTEYKNAISNACSKLSELAEVGVKLDWLKSKLDEVSLKWKKADDADGSRVQILEERMKNLGVYCFKSKVEEILERKKLYDANGSRVQKLEERIKNLELMELGFNLDCLKSKLEEVSLERKKSYDADGSRVQKLEERVKNLELMDSGFYLDCLKSNLDWLNSKLEEVSLERKKSYDADGSRFQNLEERVKNLELNESGFELDCLKSKLEEVSLERKKSYDADESRFQQLEESFKNLQKMVSNLEVELDKENAKSSADGFFLVDEAD
ncbi:MATH domain and coiled-coil domain-containing protein At2g42480 [Eutrema salsugineum]|uniref:MATH domain and coiled-coil domain-containing protein At2g42480 n=1 Tax=Eutrema salsugineum TaxID=72664 RepID=UPI000CED4E68|nr:MATH domain and coiled-coil domain-containing protein At2g42480 [Eutrema salsugineum]